MDGLDARVFVKGRTIVPLSPYYPIQLHYYYFPPIRPLRASLSSFASRYNFNSRLTLFSSLHSMLHSFSSALFWLVFFFSASPNPQSRLSPGLDVSVFWEKKGVGQRVPQGTSLRAPRYTLFPRSEFFGHSLEPLTS